MVCGHLTALADKMLAFIRYYLDLLIDIIYGLYYNSTLQPIKKASNELVLESAVSLARKIRTNQVKSEDVVRAFIDRIKEVNPLLNAVVDHRFDETIKEARLLDQEIASGAISESEFKQKPFLGVPFTTKESTAAKGLSHTFGLMRRRGRKAQIDADVIQRMKEAGAIIIAVTNVPQLNLWQETSNPVYGATSNPYNITRNAGGSSGGEGSIIAACGSPLGIGTDIGGSLRIPAFMCGIFAHKPTCNLVPTKGLTYRTGKEASTMIVAGPMVRYAEDIAPCLKVLLGPNASKLKLDTSVKIKNVKIYYVTDPKDPYISPFRKEIKHIMKKVVGHFAEVSNEPELLSMEELKYGGHIWKYWMSQEPGANFKRDLTDRQGQVNSVAELLKFILRRSEFNIAVMFRLISGLLPRENADWAEEITTVLRNKLADVLGDDGVLLYPSAPWPASYHNSEILRPWNLHLFAIWNSLKFPVTQVPLGLGQGGLPLGIQVVAPPYQDHLAIAVAKELENAFGGYVPPFPIDQ